VPRESAVRPHAIDPYLLESNRIIRGAVRPEQSFNWYHCDRGRYWIIARLYERIGALVAMKSHIFPITALVSLSLGSIALETRCR
jgi:hypothetical protein